VWERVWNWNSSLKEWDGINNTMTQKGIADVECEWI